MLSRNRNNKTGISDAKIGKNDNFDSGDDRNKKTTIKKSHLENSNNKENYENSQNSYNAERIENYYYSSIKAKEDSKNEQFLKIVNLKNDALKKIYEIRDTFIECSDCKEIYKNDRTKMLKKMQKQENLRKEFETLYHEEWDYSIVPQIPITVDSWLEQTFKFVKQQKEFLTNYQAMKPGFFTPCKRHISLGREWYMLEIKIHDYDKILINNS